MAKMGMLFNSQKKIKVCIGHRHDVYQLLTPNWVIVGYWFFFAQNHLIWNNFIICIINWLLGHIFTQILSRNMNLSLESRNDNKHRFFLNFGTASINGYILKNIALELITLILMCTFIMNINQISAFYQF